MRLFAKTIFEAAVLLESEHVKSVSRRQVVEWSIRGLYRYLDERMPPRLAQRLEKIKGMKDAELKKLLADARTHLGPRRYLDNHTDYELAVLAIFIRLEGAEPPDFEARPFRFNCWPGSSAQIGVETRVDRRTGCLRVVTPIKDGPAHKAGVLTGDLILGMSCELRHENGTQLQTFTGKELADNPLRLTGAEDSSIKLTLHRKGVARPLVIGLTRTSQVRAETIFGFRRKPDASWDFMLNRKYKIGYIRIRQFSRQTPRDVERVLVSLEKKGLKGLILDLRFSDGGLCNATTECASLFVAKGELASIRSRAYGDERFMSRRAGRHLNFPLACLVNGTTRRSSEMFAACLQDHQRAVIVGERTPGDVDIRNLESLNGGLFPIVVAVLGRPSGRNLSRMMAGGKESEDWGVRPDKGFELRLTPAERKELGEQLHRQRIIPRPDRPGADKVVLDLQLAMALKTLTGGKTK